MFRRLFAALLLLSFSAGSALALPERYEFDKDHTQITFFADHLGFAKSRGSFLDFDGYYIFDRDKPEESSVAVTIKTDSLLMNNNQKWKDHLQGADFFNVAEHPEMTFQSTSITVTGEKTADITGDLTMLGQTHPVVLHTTLNKAGQHPFADRYESGFSAVAELDRAMWGMDYGSAMMDTKVELRIEVEGIRIDGEGVHNE